jgi:hypothetical protein
MRGLVEVWCFLHSPTTSYRLNLILRVHDNILNHFTLIVSPPYSRKTRRHHSSEADTICKSPAHHYRVIQSTYMLSKRARPNRLLKSRLSYQRFSSTTSLFLHGSDTTLSLQPQKQPYSTLGNFSPTFPVHDHLAITATAHHFIFRTV